jgi:hypothetical protein
MEQKICCCYFPAKKTILHNNYVDALVVCCRRCIGVEINLKCTTPFFSIKSPNDSLQSLAYLFLPFAFKTKGIGNDDNNGEHYYTPRQRASM